MRYIVCMFTVVAFCQIAAAADANTAKDPNTTQNNAQLVESVLKPDSAGADYISGDAFNAGFSKILNNYVDDSRMVNYAKLRRMRLELNDQISRLEDLKPEVYITWSKNDKIAFWINAYNICTLKGIIDNYPIEPSRFKLLFYPPNSVIHISGLKDKTYFDIMGLQYTLNEIERDVLLGKFAEPRACFAICSGTMSSAKISNQPYLGKLLDKQLKKQIKNFFAKSDSIKIDPSEKTIHFTSLLKMYDWRTQAFVDGFGSKKLFREYGQPERAFLTFASDYISAANVELIKRNKYKFEYNKYNWTLNEAPDK